ncbi:ATP-binding protein [Erythrobacter aureus]|uniref:ATP-binding protein n=1 Tax=Erythrobacter aureus TaxID=2182384 RepID=A0A345YJ70_9SPHN|nr:ATP-binding protein [Erythrobacter aureus]AXK43972.1 hypothetical protein DVR09_16080 [Erythrobacter aureus]
MEYTPIRATVSAETITKVTRLFNGTVTDIVNELIQNSRRAGASLIKFTVEGIECGASRVTIADDGCGIDDPSRMLALGSSRWGEEVSESEDPAGMGVFSLAGKQVTIFSRHASQESAWYAEIDPDAWTGEKDIPLSETERDIGTTITFVLDKTNPGFVESQIHKAARFCPVLVELNGAEVPSEDFLEHAVYIEEWNGSRIGIFRGAWRTYEENVNFHGLTIATKLASIDERRHDSYYARLDIGSTPDLKLVLPARKEFVDNETLRDLRLSCERAIYRAIGEQEFHMLPFGHWERAKELGVDLPEAKAQLYPWVADTADHGNNPPLGNITEVTDEHVLVPNYDAWIDQPLDRALALPLLGKVLSADRRFEGYSWYDNMRRVTDLNFIVEGEVDGETKSFTVTTKVAAEGEEEPEAFPDRFEATAITAQVKVLDPKTDTTEFHNLETDVALDFDPWSCGDELDGARIAYRPNDALTPGVLSAMLKDAVFSPRDDGDGDSYETQSQYFETQALALAYELLVSEEAAIYSSFEDALRYNTPCIPDDKVLQIEVRKSVDYKFNLVDDDPAGYAARSAKALDLVTRMAGELSEDDEGDVIIPWAYITEESDDEDFDLDDESNKHNPLWTEIKAIAEGSNEAATDAPRREADFYGVWEDHPGYPSEDWQYEVANGDTRASYWDWVQSKVDADREERAEKAAERASDDQAA